MTVSKYLRMVINAHREQRGEDEIKLKDFRRTTEEAMELMKEFSSRYLNDGCRRLLAAAESAGLTVAAPA